MNKTIALIDGDVIRYQVGHACQRNTFVVNGKTFLTPNEANEYCTTHAIPNHNIQKIIAADIVQAVYNTTDKFIRGILEGAGADEARIFLTGSGNYREQLATIKPYKGQRMNDKPIHYDAITKFLVERWKAETIDGAEADDAMAYTQYDDWLNFEDIDKYTGEGDLRTVICTVDKDLNMIPGWHFNWKTQRKYYVTLVEANRFFYFQLLTGDRVDNIQGCIGVGDKGAEEAIKGLTEPADLYQAVRDVYMEQYSKFADRHGLSCHMDTAGSFSEAVIKDMHENAHLLWMQRVKDERWVPPTKEAQP